MAAYNDLKALISALQASSDVHPSSEDPLLRPFDLADDRCVHILALSFLLSSKSCAPTDDTTTHLREYTIGYCDSYLYRLSNDRATLHRALVHLENEERRAQLGRRRAVNKKAAISRLPDEVLGEILLLSMTPLGQNVWSRPALKICHHWRRVAEQVPLIWSCFYVMKSIPFECIDLWITRSAAVPLHVHVMPSFLPPEHFFQLVWQGIIQHSQRFRSLCLRLLNTRWMDQVLPITCGVDNLRELHITWSHDQRLSSRAVDIFGPLLVTPQLRMLEFEGVPGVQNFVIIPTFAVSDTLEELIIGRVAEPNMVCEFLRSCQKIRRLVWDLRHFDNTPWTPAPTCIPALERLSISGSPAHRFLKTADLPGLRRLAILDTYDKTSLCESVFAFPQITHLQLDFRAFDAQGVRSIYESLHHLEHLSCHWREEIFGAILALAEWKGRETGRTWHCPHMKRLHLAVGDAIALRALRPDTVQTILDQVIRIRAVEAPLGIILDDSKETARFADLGVQRAPLASFPSV